MAGPKLLPLLLLLPHQAHLQLTNPLARWDEFVGGVQTLIDKTHQLDDKHNACGLRAVCRGMSLGPTISRSDGSLEVQKGFLRSIVDGVGDLVFRVVRPLLQVAGMGRVARQEVSLITFVVDMLDSAIIGLARALGGRRISRQAGSPLLSLIGPVLNFLGGIPKPYIASLADFAMDATGLANTRSGVYAVVRAGSMGYAFGDDADLDICTQLDADSEDTRCVGEGTGFDLLGVLNPVNDNHLGETLRVDAKSNPLFTRTRNPQAAEYNKFEMSDLLNPTMALCKMDNMVNAVNGHIDVVEAETLPPYLELDDIDLTTVVPVIDETSTTSIVEIRREGEELDPAARLEQERDTAMVLRVLKLMEEEESKPDPYHKPINRPVTSKDKFASYCEEVNYEAKKRFYLEKLAAADVVSVTNSDRIKDAVEDNNDNEVDDDNIVDAERRDISEEDDSRFEELDLLAKLGDQSLLAEKMMIEDDADMKMEVEQLVEDFGMETEGEVVKVVKIKSRKGVSTLMIQFDTVSYRDAVLKRSRSHRSSSVRLRRPKMKDLKHVLSLVNN